jgi:hypothetical protein
VKHKSGCVAQRNAGQSWNKLELKKRNENATNATPKKGRSIAVEIKLRAFNDALCMRREQSPMPCRWLRKSLPADF